MTITITAFELSPDEGQGMARDMRVRWALEEVGQPYAVRFVSMQALKEPAHRAIQPFGQIPTYQDGDLTLFESGAIILHIGEQHPGLLPVDPGARSRAIMWMFAALNSVEPPIVEHETAGIMEHDKSWFGERIALVEKRVCDRLDSLSSYLGWRDWLDGDFSAGDLMMVHVLRRLEGTASSSATQICPPISRGLKRVLLISGRSRRNAQRSSGQAGDPRTLWPPLFVLHVEGADRAL